MNEPIEFYAEVQVLSKDEPFSHLIGKLGAVLGRSDSQSDGKPWSYAVLIDQEVYGFEEWEIKTTGKQFSRSDFYDGSSIHISVDDEGYGRIREEEPSS